MSPYKVYISDKVNPSSSNSMQIIPSWIGGYYASVSKQSSHFCFNCTYFVLIEAENELAEVFFTVKYEDSFSKVNPQDPIFSTLKPFRRHCYSFDVDEKYKNEDIIVQTTLFSGSANLLVKPWLEPKNRTDFQLSRDINSEDILILTPQMRNDPINNTDTGSIYFCLRGYDYTSYLLKIFFVSQTESLQKFNFLFSGVKINNYLPKDLVTRHRITDFTIDSDIFFDMKVLSGNPQFYGYVCEEARKCFFTKETLEILSNIFYNDIINIKYLTIQNKVKT